jgi:hypothetical protein
MGSRRSLRRRQLRGDDPRLHADDARSAVAFNGDGTLVFPGFAGIGGDHQFVPRLA